MCGRCERESEAVEGRGRGREEAVGGGGEMGNKGIDFLARDGFFWLLRVFGDEARVRYRLWRLEMEMEEEGGLLYELISCSFSD